MARRGSARALAAGFAVLLGSLRLSVHGAGLAPTQVVSEARGPRFHTAADVVQVDVGVVDAEGRPVRDLEADDFVVEEDGVEQRIESFESRTATEAGSAEPWLGGRVSAAAAIDALRRAARS